MYRAEHINEVPIPLSTFSFARKVACFHPENAADLFPCTGTAF
jgi:hypothetical protein